MYDRGDRYRDVTDPAVTPPGGDEPDDSVDDDVMLL